MRAAFESCLIVRAFTALRGYYPYSLISRFFRFMERMYGLSRFRVIWEGWLGAGTTALTNSWYYRRLRGLSAIARRRHDGCTAALRGSVVYRLYSRVTAAETTKSSVLLRALFFPGMRRLLIFAFAMYLPIDYLLRDVLSISFLASVWDELFMLWSIFYLIMRRILEPKPSKIKATPLDVPVMLFLAIGVGLMFWVSPFFGIAVAGLRATVQYILWFFIVVRLFEDDKDVMTFFLSFTALAALIALHGIYQFIVAVPIPASWMTSTETGVRTRVFSIFGSPNIMGDFMVLSAPITASLAYHYKDRRVQVAAWAVTFLMCFACLFTFSRGAWLGLAVAVFIFALYNDRRLIALMALAASVAIFIPDVYNRIAFLFTEEFAHASENGGRASRWALGMSYLMDYSNPVFGFGLGRFGGAVAMQNRIHSWMTYFYVDNYYLKILVEMGYIGLGGFIFMMLSTVATSMRAVYRAKRKSGGFAPICAGALAGLCGVLVHCYYENIFEEPYMMAYFWGIAAVIAYLGFIREDDGKRL